MKRRLILYFLISLQLKFNECGIAESKCKEYGQAVYVQRENPTLTKKASRNEEPECAISSVPLIIGGTEAAPAEFPHMAVVGFGQSRSISEDAWVCGGSLISDLYVLTASHCTESRDLGPAQVVRLGVINLVSDDSNWQEKLVTQRIRHPNFNRSSNENDIGLLKMDSKVEFTPYVRPACLDTVGPIPGTKVLASGFGKLAYESETGSKNLMKVTLDIYQDNECIKVMSKHRKYHANSMLCAGYLVGGKDTCQGDSGGPLQTVLNDPYCMYSIIGVTSFGKFCGYANSPAVYSKVSNFVPWIESIVWQ